MQEMTKQDFEDEAQRIVSSARERDVTLRLLGALAFHHHCERHRHLQDLLERRYTDIDFAGYGREVKGIRAVLSGVGYREDPGIYVESEGSRLIYEHPQTGLHLDVFLDKLEFSHTILWKDRLENDDPTIPLAEMLLQKMQIVQINEKDIIDTMMLLLDHPLGGNDDETVNIDYVAGLCAKDWGLWRTTTMNLEKVRQMATSYPQLGDPEKAKVSEQVQAALDRIDAEPKSLQWKLRAKVGDRKKWYRDVGEISAPVHVGEP